MALIPVEAIILIGIAAIFIARRFGMAWEETVAFIGGPIVLLALAKVAGDALRAAPAPPSGSIPPPDTAQPAALDWLPPWLFPSSIVFILIGVLALAAAWHFGVFRRMGSSKSWTKQNTARSQTTLYYTTAVKLGAATAAADRSALPSEKKALKRVFNLNTHTFAEADEVYQRQLESPEPLSVILRPFLAAYGRGSAVAETLIFGMTCVAMADGKMDLSELGLIRIAADALGIDTASTVRILMSAGFHGPTTGSQEQRRSRQNGGRFQSGSAPKSERERHLVTLGLTAGADKATMRKAWRKLASRYHPDKLVSQNLPPEEMEKAQAMMQSINVAYDWLKENG